MIEALCPGLNGALVLVVQGLDVGSKLVVDGLHLVGVFLLQVKPLLIGGSLSTLHVGNVLLLGLVDLLLDPVDLPIHLLPLFGALGIPALNPFIGRQFIRQGHPIVILLLLDPVHGILIRGVYQLIAQTVNLAVSFFAFLTALQITGLNTLVSCQFLLQTETVVILLLLDPVHGCLISGRNQLILNPVDLAVNLDSFLAPGLVLLLQVLISGKLVFQAELTVILLLFCPFLKSVDALGADSDDLVDHTRGRLACRNDAVLHTDSKTCANVLTQMDVLTGR